MDIRIIKEDNFRAVMNIYQEGIDTGLATFETSIPSWHHWNKNHLPFARLIAQEGESILGWAALSPLSSRHVYRGVAEISIYIAQKSRGKGVGTFLLQNLILQSEQNHIWSLQASIHTANIRSIRLHKKCGFREIGYKERIGKLNDKWLDNMLLERRSQVVGID